MTNGSPRPAPLTRFLTALAHSPELADQFRADPYGVGEAWGLTPDQVTLILNGNVSAIEAAVREEAGADASVSWWVRVSTKPTDEGAGLPDWWVRWF